jgi:curved DNA-binding protein CbpA
MTFKSHYKVLGVTRRATNEEIRTAYKELAAKWHPDKHVSESEKIREAASEEFKAISDAYQTLSDPVKRRDYDTETLFGTFDPSSSSDFGGGGGSPTSFADIATAMSDLFKIPADYFTAAFAHQPKPAASSFKRSRQEALIDGGIIIVSLEEVAKGCVKQISASSGLTIEIAPGTVEGTIYKIKEKSGRTVCYTLSYAPHPTAEVVGEVDVRMRVKVNLVDCLTGNAQGTIYDLMGKAHKWCQEPNKIVKPNEIVTVIAGAGLPLRDDPNLRGGLILVAEICEGFPTRPLLRTDLARAGLVS